MLSSTNVHRLVINNLAQLGAHIRCLRIIPFSSLDRNMSEQELDLIQFAAGQVAQTGTRPTTIPSSG